MTSQTSSPEPAGGDGLLVTIAAAVIVVVGIEALLIMYASWWLMIAVLFGVIVAAIGVTYSLARLIDEGSTAVAKTPRPKRQPKAKAEPAKRRAPRISATPLAR
jgi:predicted lysophospholipase L1 biosynthesis ABC-type transport system permease subunit